LEHALVNRRVVLSGLNVIRPGASVKLDDRRQTDFGRGA
jgi:hypothetical protein